MMNRNHAVVKKKLYGALVNEKICSMKPLPVKGFIRMKKRNYSMMFLH
jgi:hypothetical protein